MLQLFRNNQLYTIVGVFIYLLLFYTPQWINNEGITAQHISTAGFLAKPLYSTLLPYSWLVRAIFAALLLLQAILLNNLIQEHRLAKRPTYITAISYVLVAFLLQSNEGLSPAFLANTFLLFSLTNLYHSYDKNVSMARIFNVGFWIAVAALCYFSASVALIWGAVGLWLMRSFDWREWLIYGSGFFIPFFWVGVYQFWIGNLSIWLSTEILPNYGWHWQIILQDTHIAAFAVVGLLALWSVANGLSLYYKTSIREQKSINVIFWLMWLLPLSLLSQNSVQIEHLAILTIPLAALLSLNLQSIANNRIAELLHLLLFFACIWIQYF